MAKKTKKGIAYWDKKLIGPGGVLNTYIKLRDAHRFENNKPVCFCITCDKEVTGNNLHAGHYVSRRHKLVAYDLTNVNAQCAYCNGRMNGNPIKYRLKILELHGQDVLERLESAVWSTGKHHTPTELEELHKHYKGLVDNFEYPA